MAKLAQSILCVKTNLCDYLPEQVILDGARACKHKFRQRKLGPVQTVLLLILQILAGNSSLAEVRSRGGRGFSVSALSQARKRLPVAILQHVLGWLISQFKTKGPRLILVDAFNSYLPDEPELSKEFHRPSQQRRGNHFPQSRTLGVFDLETGVLIDQHEFASNKHESPQLKHILAMAKSDDILICDRGFASYANFVLLMQHPVRFVERISVNFRARQGTNRLKVRRLGKNDFEVVWYKPARAPKGFDPEDGVKWEDLPKSITLRQVQRSVKNPSGRCHQITLITNILDEKQYPADTIASYYGHRWEVETDIRHMKQTLKLEFFKTKSLENHRREVLLRAIAYNLVRLVMLRAGKLLKCPNKQISFIDACRWIESPHSPETLAKLLKIPVRKRTSRPREVKYRGKNYRTSTEKTKPQKQVA